MNLTPEKILELLIHILFQSIIKSSAQTVLWVGVSGARYHGWGV